MLATAVAAAVTATHVVGNGSATLMLKVIVSEAQNIQQCHLHKSCTGPF
jgi:hypothetical protein